MPVVSLFRKKNPALIEWIISISVVKEERNQSGTPVKQNEVTISEPLLGETDISRAALSPGRDFGIKVGLAHGPGKVKQNDPGSTIF